MLLILPPISEVYNSKGGGRQKRCSEEESNSCLRSENAEKAMQWKSLKLSKAWRRHTGNVHSSRSKGHWVKQAVMGMERKGDGSSRNVVRLLSSSPQDVDAERLHQLMR